MTQQDHLRLEIAVDRLALADIYKLVASTLVPRPIAWVTTLNNLGKVNLAPFSFFTAVSIDPPLFLINCDRRGGVSKDTTVNARSSGELVINVVSENLISPMHKSSIAAPPDVSEAELLNLPVPTENSIRTGVSGERR